MSSPASDRRGHRVAMFRVPRQHDALLQKVVEAAAYAVRHSMPAAADEQESLVEERKALRAKCSGFVPSANGDLHLAGLEKVERPGGALPPHDKLEPIEEPAHLPEGGKSNEVRRR